MSGFVAIVAHDAGRGVDPAELEALARAYQELRGRGSVHTRTVPGGWAAVAGIAGPTGLAEDEEGEAWSLGVGTVHADGGRPCTAPLGALDGQFAAVRRLAGGELEVLTDPFGMQQLFVAERDGHSYMATSALALARHLGTSPDPLGVGFFLRTGVQFGPVTHWQGVERVDPATALRFEAGRPSRRQVYWRPDVDESVRGLGLRATIDRVADVAVGLAERRLQGSAPLSADLTGGYDSRMVTSVLAAARAPFTTLTVAEERVDAMIAGRVAAASGWPFREQALPAEWRASRAEVAHALGWGDGTLDVIGLLEVLWRQEERAAESRLVVTGGGGENFGPSPWLQELWRAGLSNRVNWDNLMSMRVFLPLDATLFAHDPRAEAEPYVREVLARRVAPYAGERNTTQLDLVHAYREVGHFGAYRSAGEAHVRARLPCYDRDLWTAAFSARMRWRRGHRLHRGIIERLNPAGAAVGTERGGPAALARPGNAVRFLPYHARLARTAVRKLRGRPAPPSGARPAAAAAHRELIAALRAGGVLDHAHMRSAELYRAEPLERRIRAAEEGDVAALKLIGRVATVELALRAAQGSPGDA